VPKFLVEVCRSSFSYHTFEVEADSAEEAGPLAIDAAGDYGGYSEKDAEYEITGTSRIVDGTIVRG
jgi:hypothetical protein